VSRWPARQSYDEAAAEQFELLKTITSEVREVLGVIGSNDVALTTVNSQLILNNAPLLTKLTKVGYIREVTVGEGLRLSSTSEEAWLDLDQEQITKYRSQLESKLESIEKSVHALEHRLSNEGYVARAPEALVAESREELSRSLEQAEHLRQQLKHLSD
ncbi:hypothetical protein KBD20_01025, partial [Candidatus Saccharibacteria bacterium]|nr:hypothetical protein [Candidatus Saccharibacteria bacterium]